LLVLIPCYHPDACGASEQGKQGLMPSNFLKWGKWGADYAVLVDKANQKVMLYRSDNLFEPEKVYQCSTGENGGRKSVINDKKTPEGIYYFMNIYTKESLSPIYGSMALPLDYPNIFDVKEGRNGYGIWFHGLNKPLKANDTSGCVALVNKDIEDLASYITLNNTPVIISSSIIMASQEELEKKAKEISDIIQGWKDSWQNKDIEKYMSYYSRSFISGGKNWAQLKEYKTRLAKKYKEISVEIDDLGILTNDNVVIASFNQRYRTPVFESSGKKRLYITKNSDEWKIIGETFSIADAKQMPKATLLPESRLKDTVDEISVALLPLESDVSHEETPEAEGGKAIVLPEDPEEGVRGFIYSWIDAWEAQDTKRYISFYADGFVSDGMNLDAWKRYKDRLNKKYNSINIEISDLKVIMVSDDQAEVSFIQDYRADGYTDRGEKSLFLIKGGEEWKIKKEKWTAISR